MKINLNMIKGSKKGQVTFVNMVAFIVSCVAYFVLLPVLTSISDTTITDLQASPNEYTSLLVGLIYLLPFFILLAMVITLFNYAIPQQEGGRYP